MEQADNLLNSLVKDNGVARAYDPTAEEHIWIDSNRKVTVPDALKKIGVQHDHNIETVTFDCPRYWDGHDMSEMMVYINYIRANGKIGSYVAGNGVVDEYDDTIMHFDWTISANVTAAAGNIAFIVCVRRTDENGEVVNHWNSEVNRDMYVSKGMEVSLQDEFQLEPDIVTTALMLCDTVIKKSVEVVPDSMPTPDESLRGKLIIVPNGDNDDLYVCLRVDGHYTWAKVPITT